MRFSAKPARPRFTQRRAPKKPAIAMKSGMRKVWMSPRVQSNAAVGSGSL